MEDLMNFQLISLIVLIGTIALGFVKKVNIGFLAIGVALVLGRVLTLNGIEGFADKAIIKGFNSGLFVMLVGVTFLFSIAQSNGTLELLAKKIVGRAGKATWLIPIIMYVMIAFIAAIGPGTIPGMVLAATFGVPLAIAMKVDPLLLTTMGQIGALGGGMTSIAPTGIIGITLAEKAGITNIGPVFLFNALTSTIIMAAIVYIMFRGWKVEGENPIKLAELPKFNSKQKSTMLGIVVMLSMVLGLKVNVGLAAFLVASILILLKVGDEKEAIKSIPWGTLVLVTGVGVLMNIVISVGGIRLLADGLSALMTTRTAAPVMSLTAGIMSWFSSTSGVVMPTFIPTAPQIMQNIPNLNGAELVSAISMGSSFAGLSPASTGGGLILASYLTNVKMDDQQQNKVFVRMFLYSAFYVVVCSALVLFGLF
jgi:di/tricarboxylate transporter